MTKHADLPPALAREYRIDVAEISWIASKRAAAMRARDADWLAARYVPGAPVVGPTPPITRIADAGRDAVRIWEWFELLQGRIRWSVRVEAVELEGDRAVCRTVERASYRVLCGRRVHLHLATTIGLRRDADRWRIAYEHAVDA
ncbi:YybH family protein [Agromyces allii]|uniref:SnoaL-like domain-containing protein n=1 Tax=Agromyces allii TaxID=393607 RepID=A0ABP5BD47_9MICO|nr:nuclear transport factor 2 family protein [Agromyces allii]